MKYKLLYIISFLVFGIDIISKLIVSINVKYNSSITIIKNFFYINYVKNTGGAFSILEGNVIFIIVVTLLIFFFAYKYFKNIELNLLSIWGYGLIIGGAVGNLFDRIVYGYVIDFLDFYIFGFNFPVFNIADCGIVIGVILVFFSNKGDDKVEYNSKR